jgi:hypothetical protein
VRHLEDVHRAHLDALPEGVAVFRFDVDQIDFVVAADFTHPLFPRSLLNRFKGSTVQWFSG